MILKMNLEDPPEITIPEDIQSLLKEMEEAETETEPAPTPDTPEPTPPE